jgi:hypothetical protein
VAEAATVGVTHVNDLVKGDIAMIRLLACMTINAPLQITVWGQRPHLCTEWPLTMSMVDTVLAHVPFLGGSWPRLSVSAVIVQHLNFDIQQYVE